MQHVLPLTTTEREQAFGLAQRMADALDREEILRTDILACAIGMLLVSMFEFVSRDRHVPIEFLVDEFAKNLQRVTASRETVH